MKKIILTALAIASFTSYSQDKVKVCNKSKESYKPSPKSFTASLMLGRARFLNSGAIWRYNGSGNVGSIAPSNNTINLNSNSLVNMAGLEGKYFLSNRHAFTAELAMVLSSTPGKINLPGVGLPNSGSGGANSGAILIPSYAAVSAEALLQVHAAFGMQWYFTTKSPKLLPYLGFSLPFDLSTYGYNNPTVPTGASDAGKASKGVSRSTLISSGFNLVAGLDYYLTKEMFIGFDVKPLTMRYAINGKKPFPGAPMRDAENFSYSSFASYNFKIGFNLGTAFKSKKADMKK